MKLKETFLEVADVAREVGVTTETIKAAVKAGKLSTAATTIRGSRLFARKEVERFKRQRLARLAATAGSAA